MRDLQISPCRRQCDWGPTGEELADAQGRSLPLFACSSCGSEWVRTQAWTPVRFDGVVPDSVRAERARG
ncbi:MAG: hypothetical protein ACTHQ3_10035 [Motilibacteraceae bacterium]